jgi:pimeloyl-ACP methyl ester carboxylesterase
VERLVTPTGVTVSFDRTGSGPLLVLVHGAFSDHETNWTFVKPALRQSYTVCAIARRGRGLTDATDGHGADDEVADVVAVIEALGAPVFLLGHSYGAHIALAAARQVPSRVMKLVSYEPIWPSLLTPPAMMRLEQLAADDAWDEFAFSFFHDVLLVPAEELEAQRRTDVWPPIISDARATLGDLRALSHIQFDPEAYSSLPVPVLLQVGTESPRQLYVTDALAAVLPNVRIDELAGQAHEGMTTAPAQYVQSVMHFLSE